MIAIMLRLVTGRCKIMLGNNFSYANLQQENIREDSFYFLEHSISIFQSSVKTNEQFELIEKMTLNLISQG